MTGGGVTARGRDLLQDDRRLREGGAPAALLLGDEGAEVPGIGEGRDELLGIPVWL